jgi:LPS export ABC transporter protein LptC
MLIGLVFVAVVAACGEDPPAPPVVHGLSPVDSADQFLVGVQTRLHEGGVLRADVLADSAFLYENSVRAEMFIVEATFFTSTGVKDGVMNAKRVTYDTRVDSLQAWGDVKIVSTGGDILTTPYLRYNKALNLISSDSTFTLTRAGDETITGVGFETDPGINALKVKRTIRGAAGNVQLPGR